MKNEKNMKKKMRMGEFLIQLRMITEKDLNKALDDQKKNLVPLGLLARQNALLSNDKLFQTLKTQKDSSPGENSFSDVVKKLNFLKEDDLRKLHSIQSGTRELLGKVLLSNKAISRVNLIKALKEYQTL
tara:strand:- start:62 stop:448 length:387 start_codon:yes stop_codon:yes gene_type:complete